MTFDDECTPCIPCGPKGYGVKAKAAFANAQVISATPVEATQRDYAVSRIKALGDKHFAALREQFHMNDQRPQTATALIDAIKNGNYVLDEAKIAENADGIKLGYYNNEFGIRWGKLPDAEGFKAASEVLKAAAQKALDAATLRAPDQLEAVIDDFEAWTL